MDKMRKIIFSDIDGVFHDIDAGQVEVVGNEWRVFGDDLFRWAPLLWEVIEPHPVDLVIHSTWRYSHTLDELRARFPAPMQARIIGVTEGGGRHPSIVDYVETHGIADFIVLDDAPQEFPPAWPPLLACDGNTGIPDQAILQRIRDFIAAHAF